MCSHLYLGTSGWSYADWLGNFYPEGMASGDFLSFYAQKFRTVEIDSTFYRPPTPTMVSRWVKSTPDGFLFAAKVPREITHEKHLVDCEESIAHFLKAMEGLGEKLGPILFQFGYDFKPEQFGDLEKCLRSLPKGFLFAVEVRNRKWLTEAFINLLKDTGVALVLVDHPWMPRLTKLTTHFTYVRWLGDRKQVEEPFNQIKLDRTKALQWWAGEVQKMLNGGATVFGYFNNHYAGHSPTSLEQFKEMLEGYGARRRRTRRAGGQSGDRALGV
jgi:uncharacterized protein YecE (DUF72 family)